MNERSGRHRVSPSPGKCATAAYTLCPMNDPDIMTGGSVLSIPMSAITLPSKNPTKDVKGLYTNYIELKFSFITLYGCKLHLNNRINNCIKF